MNPTQRVKSGDLELAVYTWGEPAPGRPTVVLVHGYPDAASVWQQTAEALAQRYYVIAYDVRGAGLSGTPRRIRDFSLEQLSRDLVAVLDALSPDAPAHLVGHDWGSIQSWESVCAPQLATRIASFTSISGPCIDHAGHWMRRRLGSGSLAKMAPALRQISQSWYISAFQLPVLGPAAWKLGMDKLWPSMLRRFEGIRAEASPTQTRDGAQGVNLYRANFTQRLLRPRERRTGVPVQVIMPRGDRFMRPEVLDDLPHWVPRLWQRSIDAGHWVPLSHPEKIAAMVAEFIEFIAHGQASPELDAARRHALPQPVPVASAASHTPWPLVPRKVQFDWSNTPLEWIPGQPFASHFINEINLLLPAGEFWFCKLYNQALPHVTDPKLRADVQMFIRQEAMHARAHGAAIVEYLHAHGIETESNTRQEDRLFEVLLADQPFGYELPEFAQKQWLVFRLGVVAAIEHMTCVLGNYVLAQDQWKDADPVLLDLLRWHGAEEIEHRCVAFDVYRHLGGGYLSRYYLASIAMPAIFGLWAHGAAHILKQDPRFQDRRPSVFRPWVWLEWQRVARTGQLPTLFSLVRQQLPFFSLRYNPVNEGSTEQALAYLATSPAARAYTQTVAGERAAA